MNKFYLHKLVVPQRTDIIPSFAKEMRTVIKVREFEKEKTVFRDWIEDTTESLSDCLEHDFALWKLDKFIKDP